MESFRTSEGRAPYVKVQRRAQLPSPGGLPRGRGFPYAVWPKTETMQNLRDKLLKAGIVSANQVAEATTVEKPSPPRRAEAPRAAAPRPPRQTAQASGPLIPVRREPLATSVPKLPPLPGSREAQRLESRKQLEQDRALRDRVSAGQVPLLSGERAFYFVTRKNRLRRLELSLEQAAALESGALAVVERPEPGQIEHALVPADVAESLLRDFPRAVRFFNKSGEPVGFLSEDELRSRQETEKEEGARPEEASTAAEPGVEAPP
jgi:uncharacterized protein YaiL (DUF2058 family)